MILKHGQWVFYYVINKKKEEEHIELLMFNLDTQDEPVSVEGTTLT
jgi:hypothetical protein